jgi:L-lactate utilization protein LutB
MELLNKAKLEARLFKEFIMAVIEKIKKFVKDITPPNGEQKAKVEEKQMKMEEMKDPQASQKNKAMYDVSTEVKKFDENYKKGGMVKSSASKRADGIAVKGKTRGKIC